MSRFEASIHSTAVVRVERQRVWDAITDPTLLPELTPLLQRIDVDGDLWTWHMTRIAGLGVSISPTFTERMSFDEGYRMDYVHEPPAGVTERTGAGGTYTLRDEPDGTGLDIVLTVSVELPLPRATGPAVRAFMRATMERTGDRFSANLLKHLGVPG